MSDQINPEKLQVPLQDNEGPFYPLTTYDQIIMPDGISRWDGKSVTGDIDAKTFNGMTLEDLKAAIMAEAVYQ